MNSVNKRISAHSGIGGYPAWSQQFSRRIVVDEYHLRSNEWGQDFA